jgi:putative transposase
MVTTHSHNRKTIRFKEYNYSMPGGYFVTICTQNREDRFGTIQNGAMILNYAGCMVERWFHELEHKFADVQCDAFVCMPNHIHFVVINVGADHRVCPDSHALGEQHHGGEHAGSPLPKIVQWYKTMTTNEYMRHVKNDK